jgi:hypothetical protein
MFMFFVVSFIYVHCISHRILLCKVEYRFRFVQVCGVDREAQRIFEKNQKFVSSLKSDVAYDLQTSENLSL